MKSRRPKDPIKAAARQSRAQRRVGDDRICGCGESRPYAFPRGGTLCYECKARKAGRRTTEAHHPAGKANNPTTIDVPANDHIAELTADQYDWPQRTLQNSERSPLLAMAACIRGFITTVRLLMDRILGWIPEELETLDAFLCDQWGSQWWLKTPLRRLPPK